MKMTTKGQYALVALTHMKNKLLDGSKKPTRVIDIAEKEKISSNYLEQLFRKLRQAGIVKSIRGPGGGYVLSMEQISYAKVFDAVGEEIIFNSHLSGHSKASSHIANNLEGACEDIRVAFKLTYI